jgi:hypothetical protein
MKYRFIVPVLASMVLAAPALANDVAAPPANMAKHHGEMCNNLYARAVGKLAALDVQLKLTPAQKPLYERWKNVKLASVKARSEKCAGMKMPAREMSIMDGLKLETAMLEARLADLKAEAPALEALVNSLDKDQQVTFKRAALRAMHERASFVERFFDRRERRHHHMGMMGDDVPPPPEH